MAVQRFALAELLQENPATAKATAPGALPELALDRVTPNQTADLIAPNPQGPDLKPIDTPETQLLPPPGEAGAVSDPKDRATESDLCHVPVRVLEQCGVKTMDDLAKADAATLTPKLALVDQILDVGGVDCLCTPAGLVGKTRVERASRPTR